MSSSTTLETPFDTDVEEGTPPRQNLPAGKYVATITSASVGPTKNGRGVTINYRPPEGRTHSVFVCHSRREGTETLLYLPGIWESDLKQLAADARPKLKAAS